MYEELVMRLRKRAVNLKEKFSRNAELLSELMEAADAIEELSKQVELEHQSGFADGQITANRKKPRWIPVTERLPSYGDWVLGIGPKKGYHVCEYRGITHFPYSGDIPWFSAKGRLLTITHWMPLPEPPKEEA